MTVNIQSKPKTDYNFVSVGHMQSGKAYQNVQSGDIVIADASGTVMILDGTGHSYGTSDFEVDAFRPVTLNIEVQIND